MGTSKERRMNSNPRDDYNDAIARAYANRSRIENETIMRMKNAEQKLQFMEAGIVMGLIVFIVLAILWYMVKLWWA